MPDQIERVVEGKRDFHRELTFFLDMLEKKKNFAFTRFGDGELMIIDGTSLDLRDQKNGEFRYDPEIDTYQVPREKLKESFSYSAPDYYVGIPCMCCAGEESHLNIKQRSGQNNDNLTWANLFVNANYTRVLSNLPKALMNREVVLIGHNQMDISSLSFKVKEQFHVGVDAWTNDYRLVEELKERINEEQWVDYVFLIMAGPLANIMAYELFDFNKLNTYIDLGSCLDIPLGLPATRNYQIGGEHIARKCIW